MKKWFAMLLCFVLVGCNETAPVVKKVGGSAYIQKEICYEGVVYLAGFRKITVKFKQDGKVATCDTYSKLRGTR